MNRLRAWFLAPTWTTNIALFLAPLAIILGYSLLTRGVSGETLLALRGALDAAHRDGRHGVVLLSHAPSRAMLTTHTDPAGQGLLGHMWLGARDFEPAEYLGRPIARLMTPGERADATLDIQDPGKDAEGFEIDVCLRGPDLTVSCAADVAALEGRILDKLFATAGSG